MTNRELLDKLNEAQSLLSDVYAWASFREDTFAVNSQVESLMSVADSCILEAMDVLDWERGKE
jgi:hypothetical protein